MFEKDDSDLFNEKVWNCCATAQTPHARQHTHTHTLTHPTLLCVQFQDVPSDPVQAGKMELMKMRTLERRAKICEMQRFTKAQVSALI